MGPVLLGRNAVAERPSRRKRSVSRQGSILVLLELELEEELEEEVWELTVLLLEASMAMALLDMRLTASPSPQSHGSRGGYNERSLATSSSSH